MKIDSGKDTEELVIARLQALPADVQITLGLGRLFTSDELIAHVRKGDEIGQKITDIEMSFLRNLKSGSFYEDTPGYASQTKNSSRAKRVQMIPHYCGT